MEFNVSLAQSSRHLYDSKGFAASAPKLDHLGLGFRV